MEFTTCTIDGNNINDGTNYSTHIAARGGLDGAPARRLDTQETAFGPDVFARIRPGQRKLDLTVKILTDTETNRRQLLKWFGVGSAENETRELILNAAGWTESIRLYGTCTAVVDSTGQIVNVAFVCPDPTKYGAYAEQASDAATGAWASNALTLAIPNGGDLPMPINLRIAPGGTVTDRYRVYVTMHNRLRVPLSNWWQCITWDHATNVTAGRSEITGADVKVWVNGKLAPRYSSNWNSATTKVWFRMYLSGNRRVYLNTGPDGAGVGATCILAATAAPFNLRWSKCLDARGHVLIDAEVFAYQKLDAYTVQVTRRACWGTTAADHGYSAGVTNLPSEVVMEFGDTSAELLSNNGFETAGAGGADVFANWTESAGDGTIARTTTAGEFKGGAAGCSLTAGASANTYIYQDVTVEPGRTYHVEAWTRGNGTSSGRWGFYDVTNSAWIMTLRGTGINGTTFMPLNRQFTAPAGCVSARIYLYCSTTNAVEVNFDDVSVSLAQQPSLDPAAAHSVPQVERPAFELDDSSNTARRWEETGFGLMAKLYNGAIRDGAWKVGNVPPSQGRICRASVPSASYPNYGNSYGGIAQSSGAATEEKGNCILYYSDVPIDQITSMSLDTSANSANNQALLGYRNQAGKWEYLGWYPSAGSTYNATEATYTNVVPSDTATGLNAAGVYMWLHQHVYENLSPPHRFRLNRITINFDSDYIPYMSPSGTVHGTTGHTTENAWGFTVETATTDQLMEVGIKHHFSDRYLVLNCEEGRVYWFEHAIAGADAHTTEDDDEKTPAQVDLVVYHQGGEWLTIAPGGENLIITMDGATRGYVSVMARPRYV